MSFRSWLITGISSGIGRNLAEQVLRRGDSVVGTVRRASAVADLAAAHPELLTVEVLDVADTAALRSAVTRAFSRLGRVDVIVSNAGCGLFGAGEECTDEQIRHIVDTNLLGSIQLIRAALPHLRSQGGGRILQVSSYGGQVAFPGSSMYSATKWGIEGFVESIAAEVASFKIGVTIVEPGGVRTDFRHRNAMTAAAIADYDGTPAHDFRATLDPHAYRAPGDPTKIAQAMIDSVEREPAPLRLLLGSEAYRRTHRAISQRLTALEAQETLAFTTDS